MSEQELDGYPEEFIVPLHHYLLPQHEALDRLMGLHHGGDMMRAGIVLDEEEVREIYESNDRLSDKIEEIVSQESRQLFHESEFSDPDTVLRDPGVIVAGKLIDLLTMLDPNKISYKSQIKAVHDSANWCDYQKFNLYEGLNFHQVLGHFLGRATVCGVYETDPVMNLDKTREFVLAYPTVCDEGEREKFEKGYQIGVFRAMSDYDLLDLLPTRGDNMQVIGFDMN